MSLPESTLLPERLPEGDDAQGKRERQDGQPLLAQEHQSRSPLKVVGGREPGEHLDDTAPFLAGWTVAPGHLLGYEHSFTHEVRDLVHAIATGTDPVPSFADGLGVQLVLDAVRRSANDSAGWVMVDQESQPG